MCLNGLTYLENRLFLSTLVNWFPACVRNAQLLTVLLMLMTRILSE